MSLSVVYAADTGHVVGALAVTGGVPSADVASLVGSALPLRITHPAGDVAVLSLTDRQLGGAVVDDEAGVFDEPLGFGVTLEDGIPKPTLVQLAAWSTSLDLTGNGLVVKVPIANTARATRVLALVSDGAATHVLLGEIPQDKDQVKLPVSVDSGAHGVLVLAEGWAGRLESVTT
jgi:hypothetical protein